MKLIEALKKIKELQKKAEDLRGLIKTNSAISSLETPPYPDQKKKVSGWLQAHADILTEILRLRVAIQKTNLQVAVVVELSGKTITKTIAEWIHRRRDLAAEELSAWNMLTDKGIKEGIGQGPSGNPIEIKIIRFYDPEERDNKKELLSSEASIIDGRLEVVNAITDLIE